MAEPKEVRRLAATLREAGFGPFTFVTGTPGGSWEVGIEGKHVRATAGFVFRNGRTRFVPGTLTIDGEDKPLAEDMDDLRRIWDKHEEGASPPPESAAAVLLEIADPGREPAPYAVQAAVENMRASIEPAGLGVEVRAGLSGRHWVIGIDLPAGDGLRIVFTRYGGVWKPDDHQRVQVIAGGQDRTAEAEGDIGKALALLTVTAPPRPADAPPGISPVQRQAARRDMGVETRKRVVIRELQRQLPGERRRSSVRQSQQPPGPPWGCFQFLPPRPARFEHEPERGGGVRQQPGDVSREPAGQVDGADRGDGPAAAGDQAPVTAEHGEPVRLKLRVAVRAGDGARDVRGERFPRQLGGARRVQRGHDRTGECVSAVPAAGIRPSPAPSAPGAPAGRGTPGGGGGAAASTM